MSGLEGGRVERLAAAHPWLPLLSAAAVNAAAGTLFAWSVLLPPVSGELGVPTDELGIVFSTALVVFALAVLFGGRWVDLHGPRRAAAVAGVLCGAGLAASAGAGSVLMLSAGFGVLFGCGSGLGYLSAVSWASTRDDGHRAHAIALVVAAYAAGPVVAAPIGTVAVSGWGWRPTLAVAAVVVTAVALLASRGLPAPVGPRPGRSPSRPEDTVGDGAALSMLWLLFFGAAAPGLLAFAYGTQIATERGLSSGAAGVVVALMAGGNVAGRLLSSPLSVWLGLLRAAWTAQGALLAALVALAWSPAVEVTVLGLALLSLQYGLVSAVLPAATREVSAEGCFGTAYGRVFCSFGAAAVVGPALGAALHDGPDGYAGGFQACLAGAAVAALALAVYQRRLRIGRRTTRRARRH
jgi:OFA family oxalate/formate antiporter-like MFS transporter